jgi:hypothetical protein
MIHVEGMGWFGAITALALDRAGVPFTWSDTDDIYTAWKASTGIVYPAGDERTEVNRQKWIRWVMDGWLPEGTAKLCQYVYAHKKPPHDGIYESTPYHDFHHAQVAVPAAVAVNVQLLVTEARSRFAAQRRPVSDGTVGTAWAGSSSSPRIVAHGGERAAAWVWGWSRKVALDTPHDAIRAAYYGKRHRFDLTYAYPVTGEDGWWYAGSALVTEKTRRARTREELGIEWRRWLEASAELFPYLKVRRTQPFVQGWRPKPAPDDKGELLINEGKITPTLVFPALWHSGVRWAPTLVEQAVSWAASWER